MERDLTPQLPGIVHGVAYEDVMGGPSVDIVDDASELEDAMDRRTDPEHVYIIPASHCSIEQINAVSEVLMVLQEIHDECDSELWDEIDSIDDGQRCSVSLCAIDLKRLRYVLKKATGQS